MKRGQIVGEVGQLQICPSLLVKKPVLLAQYHKTDRLSVKKDLVVMDNSIVNSSYNLSVSEQRLILSALSQIPKNQDVEPNMAYYITREDFINLGANPDQATRDIRNATKDLMKKTVLVETNQGILEFHWLSEVLRFDKNADAQLKLKYPNPEDYKKYLEGLKKYHLLESLPEGRTSDEIVARVVFSDRILPFLSKLKANFTQFLLSDVSGFGSVYSFRLYQFMMQFKSTGYLKISLDELRYTLALNNKYKETKDLRVRVIDTAISDIDANSPYNAKYKILKTGNKQTHLEVSFSKKETEKVEGKAKAVTSLSIKLSQSQLTKFLTPVIQDTNFLSTCELLEVKKIYSSSIGLDTLAISKKLVKVFIENEQYQIFLLKHFKQVGFECNPKQELALQGLEDKAKHDELVLKLNDAYIKKSVSSKSNPEPLKPQVADSQDLLKKNYLELSVLNNLSLNDAYSHILSYGYNFAEFLEAVGVKNDRMDFMAKVRMFAHLSEDEKNQKYENTLDMAIKYGVVVK